MWNRIEVVFGLIMIVISGISFSRGLRVGIFQLAVGAILIALNFTFWKKPILTISDHGFRLKASPFSSKYAVLFSDVLELECSGPRQAHLWVRHPKKKKKVILPLQVLSPADRETLLKHLRERTSR
jgi:hypothetical protein